MLEKNRVQRNRLLIIQLFLNKFRKIITTSNEHLCKIRMKF
jgi:hypothetical protein